MKSEEKTVERILDTLERTAMNKESVFKEAFRLLKPGGVFEYSCIKGALTESGYRQILDAIGFISISIKIFSEENIPNDFFACTLIKAQKPIY
ncbi:MAG: hypothetical protein ACFFCZ_11470 [Promethearchaeota archaeon]